VKKGYGKEVIEMAKNIADFGRARILRVGLITYKEAEELFKPHVNVKGHFEGIKVQMHLMMWIFG
jgi:hypothetical protein